MSESNTKVICKGFSVDDGVRREVSFEWEPKENARHFHGTSVYVEMTVGDTPYVAVIPADEFIQQMRILTSAVTDAAVQRAKFDD